MTTPTADDPVNHPRHYNSHPSGIECVQVAEHMGFLVGNALKYLWRAGLKDPRRTVEDLRKAAWYIQRAIEKEIRESPPAARPAAAASAHDADAAAFGPKDPGRIGDWIQISGGRRFYPMDPRPGELDIETIAHALSQVNRWSGQTRGPFSVAQHSVLVSQHCDPEDALWGLLHDAPEAFLGDVSRPLKYLPWMAPYREAEGRFMAVVCEAFGLPEGQPASVGRADNLVLATEARDLFDSLDPEWEGRWVRSAEKLEVRLVPQAARVAEQSFLARFRQLTRPSPRGPSNR